MSEVVAGAWNYAIHLKNFRTKYGWPDEWFDAPDHIAVKCADATGFDATVQEVGTYSESISVVEMDERRLATATLLGPMAVGQDFDVGLVEIMEPKPEKIGSGFLVGVEHMEFFYPDFDKALHELRVRDYPLSSYGPRDNGSHRWVDIHIEHR